MAVSHITTECKRYGCMKNLLACYANCRFVTRCDELRNEIIEKPEQATTDINSYLGERGQRLIQIQFPKRGLKFTEAGRQASGPRPARALLGIDRKETPGAPSTFTRARALAASSAEPVGAALPPVNLPPVILGGEAGLPHPKPRPKRRLKAAKKSPGAQPDQPKTKIFKAEIFKAPEISKAEAREPRREPALKKRAPVKKPLRASPAVATAKPAPGADLKASSVKAPGARKAVGKKARRRGGAAATNKLSKAAPIEAGKAAGQDTEMSEQLNDKEKSVKPKKSSSSRRGPASAPRPGRKQGKKFIILEGKSASLVDEHGLMMHIMSGSSSEARYFEVNEVEARVQIVTKK